jgi:hypothetical protein
MKLRDRSKINEIKNGLKLRNCGICLEIFEENNCCIPNTCVLHIFCQDCLKRWNKNNSTCPYCRKQFKYIKKTDGTRLEKIGNKILKNIINKKKQYFYRNRILHRSESFWFHFYFLL